MTLAKAREYTRQDNKKPRLYKRGLILTTDFLLDAVHPLDDFLAQQHQNTAAD